MSRIDHTYDARRQSTTTEEEREAADGIGVDAPEVTGTASYVIVETLNTRWHSDNLAPRLVADRQGAPLMFPSLRAAHAFMSGALWCNEQSCNTSYMIPVSSQHLATLRPALVALAVAALPPTTT